MKAFLKKSVTASIYFAFVAMLCLFASAFFGEGNKGSYEQPSFETRHKYMVNHGNDDHFDKTTQANKLTRRNHEDLTN